jgi:hypothetical protein
MKWAGRRGRAKQQFEFTLILSGVRELTPEVLDAFYEAGCDDALIGMRDGVAYAEFCREADSFRQAVLSAIKNVEAASVGARVEHVEPDDLVSMSEIARRLGMTREGVRKQVAGMRGPGDFPPPVAGLTQRSPLWRWTDVVRCHKERPQKGRATDWDRTAIEGAHIAAVNAALDLRRRVSTREAIELLRSL